MNQLVWFSCNFQSCFIVHVPPVGSLVWFHCEWAILLYNRNRKKKTNEREKHWNVYICSNHLCQVSFVSFFHFSQFVFFFFVFFSFFFLFCYCIGFFCCFFFLYLRLVAHRFTIISIRLGTYLLCICSPFLLISARCHTHWIIFVVSSRRFRHIIRSLWSIFCCFFFFFFFCSLLFCIVSLSLYFECCFLWFKLFVRWCLYAQFFFFSFLFSSLLFGAAV